MRQIGTFKLLLFGAMAWGWVVLLALVLGNSMLVVLYIFSGFKLFGK